MKPRQQASRAAIELIKRFEGFRAQATQLDDRRWTIGYGHTKTARQGAQVSEADAEALLIYDLIEVSGALNDWIYTPLTQNQFDALAAFVFNIGLENFRHSGVLRRLNEGALLQAACGMEMWRKVDFDGEGIVVDALVRRRSAEKALFLTPPHGFLPAPSTVLRPRLDRDTSGQVPASEPVEIKTTTEGGRLVAERAQGPAGSRPLAHEAGEAPFAAQVAADAITARLQSILGEPAEASGDGQPEPEPPPLQAAPAAPAAEPVLADAEAVVETFSPDQSPASSEGAGLAGRMQEAEPMAFSSEPATLGDFESRRVVHHEFEAFSEFDRPAGQPGVGFGPLAVWLAVGAVGLIIFAAGIFFGFNAKNAGAGGYIGWGLGLVGIACVATAVYFLLERLGGREEL